MQGMLVPQTGGGPFSASTLGCSVEARAETRLHP